MGVFATWLTKAIAPSHRLKAQLPKMAGLDVGRQRGLYQSIEEDVEEVKILVEVIDRGSIGHS